MDEHLHSSVIRTKVIFKGVVHLKKKKKKKTFPDNLLTPVIQDVHDFLSSVEKKLRFLMKTFQDFVHIIDFIENQMVQGPNESFSAASNGFWTLNRLVPNENEGCLFCLFL